MPKPSYRVPVRTLAARPAVQPLTDGDAAIPDETGVMPATVDYSSDAAESAYKSHVHVAHRRAPRGHGCDVGGGDAGFACGRDMRGTGPPEGEATNRRMPADDHWLRGTKPCQLLPLVEKSHPVYSQAIIWVKEHPVLTGKDNRGTRVERVKFAWERG